jgi:hypothetical protein
MKQLLKLLYPLILARDQHSKAGVVCIFCISSGEKHAIPRQLEGLEYVLPEKIW